MQRTCFWTVLIFASFSLIASAAAQDAQSGGLELDGALGVAATGVRSSADARPGTSGELTGALTLKLTDWGRADCTPICGPQWTNRFGVRTDLYGRGFAVADDTGSPDAFDFQLDQSAEVALWFVSLGQTFTYQEEGTFYRTFWRPHDDMMTAGFTARLNMLSGFDENVGVEVLSVRLDWRRLAIRDDVSPFEFTIDAALIDATARTGTDWFERFGLGLVTLEHYGLFVGREGDTKVSKEVTNLTFDFLVSNGIQFWDAPWKLDATLGLSVISPLSEIRRTPVMGLDGGQRIESSVGPTVVAPHLWLGAHHISGRENYLATPSVIFEAIPEDTNYGMGVGSFQRIDSSGFAVDTGAQAAGYARLSLSPSWMLRGELLGVFANRTLVSELAEPLPLGAGDSVLLGRAEAGAVWALTDYWLLSVDLWAEYSDRETRNVRASTTPSARVGARAGLSFSF